MAAAAIARSALKSRSSSYILISKRFLSSFSITKPILRPSLYLSHSLQPFSANSAARMTSIRRRFNHYGSDSGDRPSSETAEPFPGCDYKHWLIIMDKPGGQGANKQQMVDFYVQTLATVLGSEEEAKKKIYSISCSPYFGFGCEIDEDTSNRLEGLPGVVFVLPDCYVDPENKDYGAELYVNGEIVQRSPERQMRVEPVALRAQEDIPRDNGPDSLCQAP